MAIIPLEPGQPLFPMHSIYKHAESGVEQFREVIGPGTVVHPIDE